MRVALPAPIVGKLGEEFDRVFDRLLAPRLFAEPLLPPFPYETAGTEWFPMLDLTETGEEFIVRLEVPGLHKENLDINLTGAFLCAQEAIRIMKSQTPQGGRLKREAPVPAARVMLVAEDGKPVRVKRAAVRKKKARPRAKAPRRRAKR